MYAAATLASSCLVATTFNYLQIYMKVHIMFIPAKGSEGILLGTVHLFI